MVAPRPQGVAAAQPPPDLPNMPEVSDKLSDYLRRFSLWCRHGFAAKLDASTAAPGVLLQAYDATPGTNPAVWLVRVNSAGVVSTVAQPLGTGKP
jgi:hypothetical protein